MGGKSVSDIIIIVVGSILSIAVIVVSVGAMIIVFSSPPMTKEQKKNSKTLKKLSAQRTLINVLIWIGTFLTGSFVEVLLGYLIRYIFPDYFYYGPGIPGALPKTIFWVITFFAARKPWRVYNEHFMKKYGSIIAACEAENIDPVKKDSSDTDNTNS